MAAEPTVDGPGLAIATRQQDSPADQQILQDASADQDAEGGASSRNALIMVGVAFVVLAAVLAAITVISSSARQSSARQLTEDQLRPGDCLTGSNLDLGVRSLPYLVTAAPCTGQHLAEVFFSSNVWPQSLAAYPGDDAVVGLAIARCSAAFKAYDGIYSFYSAFSFDYFSPDSNTWASGDRQLTCLAYKQGTPVNYSIKGSRR